MFLMIGFFFGFSIIKHWENSGTGIKHGTHYDHCCFDEVFLSPANECKVVELDLYNSYDYYLATIILVGITKQISKKKQDGL